MNKILVTDSLFIGPDHVRQIEGAGFEVERLDKPAATEAELIEAIKGKVGYILGGIERVTEPVIAAADELKAIVFTGVDSHPFIPAWQAAEAKGIVVASTPDGPTQPVAEWCVATALAMNRGLFELGGAGEKNFMVTPGLANQNIVIVGLGRIGARVAELLKPFRTAGIRYHTRSGRADQESEFGISYQPLDELLAGSDVVFICVSGSAQPGYIGKDELAKMKPGALLVFMQQKIVDESALLEELQSGRIRAASDHPGSDDFKKLPAGTWYSSNGSVAFMTAGAIAQTSHMAVEALLKALK